MQMNSFDPYISVTDITSAEQVQQLLKVVKSDTAHKTRHLLGVGVMMSYKTLHGLPTKWANAFPPKEVIANIFLDDPFVCNVLHYADYDNVTTIEDYREAISWGGKHLNAIQLDMVWPDINDIRQAFKRYTTIRHKIILQVGARAMEEAGNDPDIVAEKLVEYYQANCLDAVLFDKSMGQGKGMDAELLITYCKALRKRLSDKCVGMIAAGGLGPTTINLLNPFKREGLHTDISICAQVRLRPSRNALDPIDIGMTIDYWKEAKRFFSGA
ncbi:hypothetical protein FJY93_00320 [Candidatus Kaiserbacteria bacterium]|nr:hypothetical protein [Candidatus Kaiserbacteria bacterium]